MSRVVTAAAAEDLSRKMTDPAGRYEIGQTMLEPFKEGRDYVSVGRKFFAVHHVEPGAPMWYDIDPQFSCIVIGNLGAAPRVLDGAQYDRVELSPFAIAVLVRIGVQEPAIRRFDVLDREQVRAQAEMAETEDVEVFKALRAGAQGGNGTGPGQIANGVAAPGNVSGTFTLANLATAYGNLEHASDSHVENLLMNAKTYRNFRTLDTNGGIYDPVTRRELLKTGYVGDIWNAQVRISKKEADNEIILAASPEFLGVISVRIDLSQMDAPNPELLQYGWVLYEFIAVAQLTNVGSALYTITG